MKKERIITLTMEDGTTEQISSSKVMPAFMDVCHSTGDGYKLPESGLIAKSISDDGLDQGQGHMCQLIRVIAAGPVKRKDTPEEASV